MERSDHGPIKHQLCFGSLSLHATLHLHITLYSLGLGLLGTTWYENLVYTLEIYELGGHLPRGRASHS